MPHGRRCTAAGPLDHGAGPSQPQGPGPPTPCAVVRRSSIQDAEVRGVIFAQSAQLHWARTRHPRGIRKSRCAANRRVNGEHSGRPVLTKQHAPASLRRSARLSRSRRAARAIGLQIGLQIGLDDRFRISGAEMRLKWPLSCGFVRYVALRRARLGARFHARNRDSQASDLRFYGAPKGIRILIVLVTIGTRWDSLVQRSCGESQ